MNGRKVQEFSLLQAVEYGCQGFFPNGTHPVAALFVQVDPSMVDFNIHPAKKEVRFKDISSLHHGISSSTKNFFRSCGVKSILESEKIEKAENSDSTSENLFKTTMIEESVKVAEKPFYAERIPDSFSGTHKTDFSFPAFSSPQKNRDTHATYKISHTRSLVDEAIEPTPINLGFQHETQPVSEKEDWVKSFKYIGSSLGTFLLAEVNGALYFIDQHAAHERILFDKLMESEHTKQNLMIPLEVETESDDDDHYIESQLAELEKVGFTGKKIRDGKFEFTTIPARWNGSEENLKELLLEERLSPKDLVYKIAAMTACKAAVKDGTLLDPRRAEDLAREALTLPDPHCPHGRPVWTVFTKESLFARVRRIDQKNPANIAFFRK